MRVYHDSSIDNKIKCELECLRDKNNNYLDIVDFCNVEEIPRYKKKFNETAMIFNKKYLQGMFWRFLPISDLFVDIFQSRDSDSIILQREIDSVNVWLNSNNVGHIMRGDLNEIILF